jgi:hypothetical protein
MSRRTYRFACGPLALAGAFALLGAGEARSGAAPLPPIETPADTGRPVGILVHGRGELPGDSVAARKSWTRAIKSGTATLSGDSLLRDDDVWVAWYADALDPLAPPVCDAAPRPDRSRDGTGGDDDGLRAFFAAIGEGLTATLDMLDGHARDEARALAGDFLFIGDPVRRCAAETQLARVLARATREGRPVILVAHSFGALLSYGYLQSSPPDDSAHFTVRKYVTIGSLLGAPGVRSMLLGDTASRARLPNGVERWSNIVNPRDALAYSVAFETSADSAANGRAENLTTSAGTAGEDSHYIGRYLRDPVTVRSVVGAWCDAFPAGGRATSPVGCQALAGRR